jgi:hypothetical protein
MRPVLRRYFQAMQLGSCLADYMPFELLAVLLRDLLRIRLVSLCQVGFAEKRLRAPRDPILLLPKPCVEASPRHVGNSPKVAPVDLDEVSCGCDTGQDARGSSYELSPSECAERGVFHLGWFSGWVWEGGWPKMPAAFRALPRQRLEVRMSRIAAARISQCRLPRGPGAEQEKDE